MLSHAFFKSRCCCLDTNGFDPGTVVRLKVAARNGQDSGVDGEHGRMGLVVLVGWWFGFGFQRRILWWSIINTATISMSAVACSSISFGQLLSLGPVRLCLT